MILFLTKQLIVDCLKVKEKMKSIEMFHVIYILAKGLGKKGRFNRLGTYNRN